MKWPKDRRKAFLWAAKAFGTPLSKRTMKQRWLTSHGICRILWQLSDSTGANWLSILGNKMKIEKAFWWPIRGSLAWTHSCDDERSRFCYLMAALSHKEFEEISEKNT